MSPPIKAQTKQVVYKVYEYFKTKKADPNSAEHKDDINIQKTVAKATGLSERSVQRIVNAGRSMGSNVKFSSPRRPKQTRKKKIAIDDFTKSVIRRKVTEFYTVRKEIPTINKLRKVLEEDGVIKCGYTYMRLLLRELGFRYKKCQSKRKMLIERHSIQQWRGKYITAIRKYRSEERPIYFQDETYVNESQNVPACWQSNTERGALSSIGKGNRLVIVHAGGSSGFVEGALTIFKPTTKTEDYHGNMNYNNFEKWVREKLLPSLPPNSVIVMDNAKYHCNEVDKAPTMCSLKKEMQDWLKRHNIEYTEAMKKRDLQELINQNKPEKQFKIDAILKEKGHNVLYLPPYHPDLNPIELVWGDIKGELARKYINSNLTEKKRALEELFAKYSVEKWQKCDNHVKKVEEEYYKNDNLSDEIMDQFIISLRDGESDNESDSNHTDSDSSTDSNMHSD